MRGLWFDQIAVGQSWNLGSYEFSREAILSFARRYDPQPFHLDDAAAARSYFGRLSASGWHTAAAWMKCYIASDHAACREALARGEAVADAAPSPGFANLRWIRPVRVGDVIRYDMTIASKRELASRRDLGLVQFKARGSNRDEELAFSFDGKVMVHRRKTS